MSNIKILVAYHKPSFLVKSDIYVPIHLGRAIANEQSKDGSISKEDYKWLVDNMIGDDTGENISSLNRHFNEVTAIYWAWKNYEKLGNPDYIGLVHYRRFFQQNDLTNCINYDITGGAGACPLTYEEQYPSSQEKEHLIKLFEDLRKSKYKEGLEYINTSPYKFFYNMFIMKKEIFFEYCEFLFDILFKLHESIDYTYYAYASQRTPGCIAERLTGVFIGSKAVEGFKINAPIPALLDLETISPVFKEKYISLCFSSNDEQAMYLIVALQSLKTHKNTEYSYDIWIIDNEISEKNKWIIETFIEKDFSIRFYKNQYLMNNDFTNINFKAEIYFSLTLSNIFNEYSKMLFLPTDIIIQSDIAELYNTDLEGKALAGVNDIEVQKKLLIQEQGQEENFEEYLTKDLGMKNIYSYFRSDILLVDIKKLNDPHTIKNSIEKLQDIHIFKNGKQCIFNALFDGDIKYLDAAWNFVYIHEKLLDYRLPFDAYLNYSKAMKNPRIINYLPYLDPIKNQDFKISVLWWKYANQSPNFHSIIRVKE